MQVHFNSFETFFGAMKNAQYAFLYLEPVLVWGIAFGILLFLFASLVREQKCQVLGMGMIVAACMMVSPYVNQRLVAQKGIEQVYSVSEPSHAESMKEYTRERRNAKWIYFLTATLGIVSLLFGIGKSSIGRWTAGGAVAVGLITVFYGSLIHLEESRFYHPHLRSEPVPGPQPYATDGEEFVAPPSWVSRN